MNKSRRYAKKEEKRCTPGTEFVDGSCAKLEVLVDAVKAFNTTTDQPINMRPNLTNLNPSTYKNYLVNELKRSTGVSNQNEWLKHKFVHSMNPQARNELLYNTWRAEGPQGRFEWLNTINIEDVMAQYEKKHPDFIFLGAVPIDFDDLPTLGIASLDFQSLLDKGKSKIGIIFNLDRHDQSGSHWVASYADLKKCQVYFFDSYGIEPVAEIKRYMNRIKNFCKSGQQGGVVDVKYNKHQHQYENSECGVYSINFIVRLLGGKSFKEIQDARIPDNKIHKCRNVYFGNVNV